MQHGFALAGVTCAESTEHGAAFRAWIDAGKQGQMEYLAQDLAQRLDPAALVPGARSILCVADRYATGRADARMAGAGRIARYARGEDYHAVLRARLEALAEELRRAHPGHRFRVCVDTAPLLEREHAARAGLGRIGKHTLLIAPDGLGSWIALGAIVTTLPLAAVRAAPAPSSADPCGGCTRCIDACPTGAITPWSVDATRCTSYLTIEHDGTIPAEFAGRTGDWLFGCDICQEVCPHSQPTNRALSAAVHPAYEPHHGMLPLLQLLAWSDQEWEAARFNAVLRRADAAAWRRNAALAAGSALRDPTLTEPMRGDLVAQLARLAADAAQPGQVRAAARDALAAGE